MATYKAPKNIKTKPMSASNDILIYADFGCTTGFGNVAKELVDRWAKTADKNTMFYVFALSNFEKEPYDYLPNVRVLPANVMPLANNNDSFQLAAFVQLFSSLCFNVIYMLNDVEIVGKISGDLLLSNIDKKKKKLLQHKTIFYFPIDSLPRANDLDFLQRFDEIATFTDYGRDVIQKFSPQKVGDKIQVIPHGVNSTDFYELPKEEILEAKEKLFGADKFVIGTVNRNSARKDIANTILGFHKFYNEWNNVQEIQDKLVLYCHCNPEDVAGPNLRYLLRRLNLVEGKNIFFPKEFSENKGFSVSELNTIYNTFDVFITTSTAEGWGLTLTEAMATKTLCLAPLHTSFIEITDNGKNCVGLKTEETVFCNDTNKIRYKTLPTNVASTLHYVKTIIEPGSFTHEKVIENAYNKVILYSWDNTADEFWNLITKYLK